LKTQLQEVKGRYYWEPGRSLLINITLTGRPIFMDYRMGGMFGVAYRDGVLTVNPQWVCAKDSFPSYSWATIADKMIHAVKQSPKVTEVIDKTLDHAESKLGFKIPPDVRRDIVRWCEAAAGRRISVPAYPGPKGKEFVIALPAANVEAAELKPFGSPLRRRPDYGERDVLVSDTTLMEDTRVAEKDGANMKVKNVTAAMTPARFRTWEDLTQRLRQRFPSWPENEYPQELLYNKELDIAIELHANKAQVSEGYPIRTTPYGVMTITPVDYAAIKVDPLSWMVRKHGPEKVMKWIENRGLTRRWSSVPWARILGLTASTEGLRVRIITARIVESAQQFIGADHWDGEIEGPNMRFQWQDQRERHYRLTEMPSPGKRRLRIKSGGFAPWLGVAQKSYYGYLLMANVARHIHSSMTYEQAAAEIDRRIKELVDESNSESDDPKPLKDLASGPWETTVFYLEVEPPDTKPFVVEGKDFKMEVSWGAFKVYSPNSDFQQADPHYTRYGERSPTGARKLYKILKANPDALRLVGWDGLGSWFDRMGVPYDTHFSQWH
jgi:hypothetical protein